MPKKFQGENSKSSVARARKAEQAAQQKATKEKMAEEEYWKDDDKHLIKKLQRKGDKEQKKLEEQSRKKEKKMLEEQENMELSKTISSTKAPSRLTVHQIQLAREQEAKNAAAQEKAKTQVSHLDAPLMENLNRNEPETVSASGLDAAVAALSVNESSSVDRHPEKRMAAAFRAYEERELPILKKQNPTMRLTQLKQLLRKNWQKSPENPLMKKGL